MSIPVLLTYDIVPPRRPSIDDVGGAAFQDDQKNPPNQATMPSSAMENQNEMQVQAAHKVLPVCVFSIKFTTGTPSLDSFSTLSSLPITGTFTFVDNGTGDTSVTWPANTFPTAINKPKGGITGATIGQIAVEAITNGVRVRTANAAGAATDLPCTVEVF